MRPTRASALLALAAVLAGPAPGRAELTMTLAPSVKHGARGTVLVFSGTLANTDPVDKVFLNDIAVQLSGPSAAQLSLQPNVFFANVPGILLPGESYNSAELFGIEIAGAAPAGDYGGTVMLRGGGDIVANSDLADAVFTVLSPEVSLAASDASASEFGPDPGSITVTRTGGTGIELPVSCAIGGTAANGAAYVAIPSTTVIPAGELSATIAIAPIPNNLAEGDRSVTLTLAPSGAYNAGAGTGATVTIHDKPADEWRWQHFGVDANDPAAADGADWDGDGSANLLEYFLGSDPRIADTAALPAATVEAGYLTISFVANLAAADASHMVEASTDLSAWDTDDVEDVTGPNPAPPGRKTYRYAHPMAPGANAFLRIKVTR